MVRISSWHISQVSLPTYFGPSASWENSVPVMIPAQARVKDATMIAVFFFMDPST